MFAVTDPFRNQPPLVGPTNPAYPAGTFVVLLKTLFCSIAVPTPPGIEPGGTIERDRSRLLTGSQRNCTAKRERDLRRHWGGPSSRSEKGQDTLIRFYRQRFICSISFVYGPTTVLMPAFCPGALPALLARAGAPPRVP